MLNRVYSRLVIYPGLHNKAMVLQVAPTALSLSGQGFLCGLFRILKDF